jgi:hypothetical protein
MGMYDDFKGMLGDHLPNWLPEDPNKNAAARQGLLALGATMMGARGNLGESLSQGLLAGAGGYNGAMAQQGQQQLRDAQMKQTGLENQKLQAGLDEPAQIASILSGNGPISTGAPGGVKPVSALPQIGAAPAPAQPMAQGQAGAPQQAPGAASQYDTYMQYGDRLTQAGKPAAAKQYYDIAEKMRPKIKEQRVLTIDGQRVMANVFEDGRTERVDGFSPDAEKLSFQNTGGATVALDPFTGKPVNTIRNTQSPDSVASNATTMRGQNMADRRSAESNENARGVIIQTDQGPMLANSRTGTTKPILGGDGKPVTRTKALTEFEGKSAAFGDRAMAADKTLNDLEGKYNPVVLNTKASVEGVPLIGGASSMFLNKFKMNSADQRTEQARRDFINATLRQESGAAIGASEFENASKQYFPQPGDGKEVIAQKAANRKLVIAGFKRSAGSNARFTEPGRAADASHPDDISNLLNKYGGK